MELYHEVYNLLRGYTESYMLDITLFTMCSCNQFTPEKAFNTEIQFILA